MKRFPVEMAAEHGHAKVVALLKDVVRRDAYLRGLSAAVSARQTAVLDIMLQGRGQTSINKLFLQAVHLGDLLLVEWLLHEGADVNHVDLGGFNALHSAIAGAKHKIVERILRDNGISLLHRDRKGRTILHLAVSSDSEAIWNAIIPAVEQVPRSQSMLRAEESQGYTAMDIAASLNRVTSLKALIKLERSFKIDSENHILNALHQATLYSRFDAARVLIKEWPGLPPEIYEAFGNGTPLDLQWLREYFLKIGLKATIDPEDAIQFRYDVSTRRMRSGWDGDVRDPGGCFADLDETSFIPS